MCFLIVHTPYGLVKLFLTLCLCCSINILVEPLRKVQPRLSGQIQATIDTATYCQGNS